MTAPSPEQAAQADQAAQLRAQLSLMLIAGEADVASMLGRVLASVPMAAVEAAAERISLERRAALSDALEDAADALMEAGVPAQPLGRLSLIGTLCGMLDSAGARQSSGERFTPEAVSFLLSARPEDVPLLDQGLVCDAALSYSWAVWCARDGIGRDHAYTPVGCLYCGAAQLKLPRREVRVLARGRILSGWDVEGPAARDLTESRPIDDRERCTCLSCGQTMPLEAARTGWPRDERGELIPTG